MWLKRNGKPRRGSGREVVAYLLGRERDALVAEWRTHRRALSAKEKARIMAGNYHSFRRPIKPDFEAGDWLEVRKGKLLVRVVAVELYKGEYRIRLDRVWDDRNNGPRIKASHRNEEGELEPEKDGVDKAWLDRFAEEAARKREALIRDVIAR